MEVLAVTETEQKGCMNKSCAELWDTLVLAALEELETLPAGTKPQTSHRQSPGGERHGKRKRSSLKQSTVEEAGAGERGRECENEIFTYLFYIYCYFKCTFLSPCVKGKFSFLCFVY